MFFYREPEEPKKDEDGELAAAQDYPLPTDYAGGALDWGTQNTEGQWNQDMPAPGPVVSGVTYQG